MTAAEFHPAFARRPRPRPVFLPFASFDLTPEGLAVAAIRVRAAGAAVVERHVRSFKPCTVEGLEHAARASAVACDTRAIWLSRVDFYARAAGLEIP